jgi:hypothetical protein
MSGTSLFTRWPILNRLLSRGLTAALLAAACALVLLHPAAAADSNPAAPQNNRAAAAHIFHPTNANPFNGSTAEYVHYSTAANSYASWTDLDNAVTNNNPSAIVFVTPNWNPGGVWAAAFDAHPLGVWYDIATNKWAIFNEDESPMPIGAAFNVFAFPSPSPYEAFIHVASANTISGNSSDMSSYFTDGLPNNILLVTPNWSAGGVYDTHPLGVYYHYETNHWAIFHEDGVPIPAGATYNVLSRLPGESSQWVEYLHTATSASSGAGSTGLDNPALNGHPNETVFVTQVWTELHCFQTIYGPLCILPSAHNNSAVSVYYDTSTQRWRVFNETGAPVPNGALFSIIDLPTVNLSLS